MVAASYHPRIVSPKYGQTGNLRLLTAKRGFQFTARWLNLDLEVYYNDDDGGNLYMKLSTKYNLSKDVIGNTTHWHINA